MDFILPGSTGYLVIKALHIIAVIFWMAGMLYLPRLFVYHHQAQTAGSWKGRC
jgi:putative membrane protein